MPPYNQTPENRCMPFEEWPALDCAAWRTAKQPAEYLEKGGIAAGWSDGGLKMVVDGYGYFLTWMARTAQLDATAPSAARVTPDIARAYLADMESRLAPMTVQGRIRQLGRAMRALAPEGDWGWLFREADRLRTVAAPVRDKRGRMQEVDALVGLGSDLMRRASCADDHFALSRAVLYRDGLILALLALRPLRMRTFAALTIDQHLIKQPGGWRLDLEPTDTKTKRQESIPFPSGLVEALNIYLQEHRPVLLRTKSITQQLINTPALWVAKGGRQLGGSAISLQIRTHTKAAFGKSINPHLFRDCAATSIAINDPTHIYAAQVILGHRSYETSERYYNQAKGLEATRRYQKHLDEVRQEREHE